jgi:hypothetical protein
MGAAVHCWRVQQCTIYFLLAWVTTTCFFAWVTTLAEISSGALK